MSNRPALLFACAVLASVAVPALAQNPAPAAAQPLPAAQSGGSNLPVDQALEPPTGYSQQDAVQDASPKARKADHDYALLAERWASINCIMRERPKSSGGGIVGGILGGVIGANLANGARMTRSTIGGTFGNVTGISPTPSAGPGCPPGFLIRADAPAFSGTPISASDAPSWYNPWIWYEGRWIYRPYPYHRYWHDHPEYGQLPHAP